VSAFDEALERYRNVGASRAADDELMAAFCKYNLPHIVGAVSPKLVWEGARKRGLSTKELAAMAATDVMGVSDLQWI
jgi:hypothetical protein